MERFRRNISNLSSFYLDPADLPHVDHISEKYWSTGSHPSTWRQVFTHARVMSESAVKTLRVGRPTAPPIADRRTDRLVTL